MLSGQLTWCRSSLDLPGKCGYFGRCPSKSWLRLGWGITWAKGAKLSSHLLGLGGAWKKDRCHLTERKERNQCYPPLPSKYLFLKKNLWWHCKDIEGFGGILKPTYLLRVCFWGGWYYIPLGDFLAVYFVAEWYCIRSFFHCGFCFPPLCSTKPISAPGRCWSAESLPGLFLMMLTCVWRKAIPYQGFCCWNAGSMGMLLLIVAWFSWVMFHMVSYCLVASLEFWNVGKLRKPGKSSLDNLLITNHEHLCDSAAVPMLWQS